MYSKLIGLLYLLNVIFLSAGIRWIKEQYSKDCTCAQDWRLRYMSAYLMIGVVFNIIGFSSLVLRRNWKIVFEKYLVPVMSLLTVAYVSMSLSYFVDLQKKDCDCSKGPQERFMYYISFIQVIVVGGSFLMRIFDKTLTALH